MCGRSLRHLVRKGRRGSPLSSILVRHDAPLVCLRFFSIFFLCGPPIPEMLELVFVFCFLPFPFPGVVSSCSEAPSPDFSSGPVSWEREVEMVLFMSGHSCVYAFQAALFLPFSSSPILLVFFCAPLSLSGHCIIFKLSKYNNYDTQGSFLRPAILGFCLSVHLVRLWRREKESDEFWGRSVVAEGKGQRVFNMYKHNTTNFHAKEAIEFDIHTFITSGLSLDEREDWAADRHEKDTGNNVLLFQSLSVCTVLGSFCTQLPSHPQFFLLSFLHSVVTHTPPPSNAPIIL